MIAAAYQLMPTKGVGDDLEPAFRPSQSKLLLTTGYLLVVDWPLCDLSLFLKGKKFSVCGRPLGNAVRVGCGSRQESCRESILWFLERATPEGGCSSTQTSRIEKLLERTSNKISVKGSRTASSASDDLFPRRRYHACVSWPREGLHRRIST